MALLASCLAYGRVAQILRSVREILRPMNPSPRSFLEGTRLPELRRTYAGFVHRFAIGEHIASLLFSVRRTLRHFGSLNDCFLAGFHPRSETTHEALAAFVDTLVGGCDTDPGHLLPRPQNGSACKRLHLFLRWMVRKDAVDPGGWRCISPAKLIVPVDVHMHRFGRRFGFTRRRQADLRTALEITAGYRRLAPDDPVRYDFVLTRLGIRNDTTAPPWAGIDGCDPFQKTTKGA